MSEEKTASILLVDDDEQLRNMTKQMLERANYLVHEAADGKAGQEFFRNNKTDLIITDLMMPNQDGLMFIQDILSEFPDAKVIAISGGATGNAAWLPIAKKAGARQVLKKPFQREQLLTAVTEVLRTSW